MGFEHAPSAARTALFSGLAAVYATRTVKCRPPLPGITIGHCRPHWSARAAALALLSLLAVALAAGVAAGNSTAALQGAENESSFQVSVEGTNSPVDTGETVTVDVRVENVGDGDGTQNVTLTANGSQVAKSTIELAAGENTTESFEWETSTDDQGDYELEVASETHSAETQVTIHEPASFDVVAIGTNAPVSENGTLSVDATVENVGGQDATQTITLNVDETQRDSIDRTLDPGENGTVTLDWQTAAGDAGNHTVTVSSEDDDAQTAVTVLEPASFDVSIADTNAPVLIGESVVVNATVENVGDEDGNGTVALTVNGSEVDTQPVSLAGGDQTSRSLEWTAGADAAGTHDLSVTVGGDSDSATVTVEEPATLSVTLDGTNGPVQVGEALQVDATVQNDGDRSASPTLNLSVGGAVVASTDLTVPADDGASATLNWSTDGVEDGEYATTVSTPEASAETTVTVEAPPEDGGDDSGGGDGGGGTIGGRPLQVAVSDVEVSATEVAPGESIVVEATVRNVDDRTGVRELELVEGLTRVDGASVALTPGEERRVTLEGSIQREGAYDFDLAGTALPTIEVRAGAGGGGGEEGGGSQPTEPAGPADVRVTASAPAEVRQGESRTLDVLLENAGESAGEMDFEVIVGGLVVEQTAVTVPANGTDLRSYELDTAEPGEETWRIVVDDRIEAAGTVEVGAVDGGTAPDDVSDETPGLGIGAALVAILAAVGFTTRRS